MRWGVLLIASDVAGEGGVGGTKDDVSRAGFLALDECKGQALLQPLQRN
jgi:hypothetical protein